MALEAARGVHDRDTAAACNARSNVYFKYAARISPRKFNDQLLVRMGSDSVRRQQSIVCEFSGQAAR